MESNTTSNSSQACWQFMYTFCTRLATTEVQPDTNQYKPVPYVQMLKHIKGVGGESSVKWPLPLPKSLLEQKHTNSQQQEQDGWAWREQRNGSAVGLTQKRRDSFPLWQVWVGWLHVPDVAGLCKGDEGGRSLSVVGWNEGKREIPLPESRHLLPLATPRKLFMTPHILTNTHTHTNIFRLNSHFLLLPCHSFLPTLLYLYFSHTLTDHWGVFGPGICCWAKKSFYIPVHSLLLTHTNTQRVLSRAHTDTEKKRWRKTTSSELCRFIFLDSLHLTGSSDL